VVLCSAAASCVCVGHGAALCNSVGYGVSCSCLCVLLGSVRFVWYGVVLRFVCVCDFSVLIVEFDCDVFLCDFRRFSVLLCVCV